jgi:deoxyribodipyrimidine photolyase-related protein
MRRRHRVLLDAGDGPEGGRWNFDADNRSAFPKSGPGEVAPPALFAPDDATREVMALVARRFPNHPGSLDHFAWPVTRAQALTALDRFVDARLEYFGRWQDAMWTDLPFGWHSLLAISLNLKLLNPREVIAAAERARRERRLPLAAVEGFIRQLLGWREFIRGVYWQFMPQLAEANVFGHSRDLPRWYWNGETRMACMRTVIGQTMDHGYAQHIQRLMVTGLYALLFGVRPQEVHAWYLGVYVDAVEWVELHNTLGMSQYGDGGLMASKPYVASGKYIERMSGGSLCARCRYRPAERSGDRACPFTTLYWDFLLRHESLLATNPRMVMQVKNLARLSEDERARIRAQAAAHRTEVGA